MNLPSHVRLIEVGPRDGLQNEAQAVPAAVKVEFIQRLQAAGLSAIEVTSFVSPKRVPQMADGAAVLAGLMRESGVRYSALVPNLQGLEAALACAVDEIVVFGAASETFSQRNIQCSIAESIERFAPVVQAARARGVRVRGVISTAVACPYEGEVPPARVGEVAARMQAMGVQHLCVADTLGVGTPLKVQRAMEAALAHFPLEAVGGHFHDTYGQALANTLACLQMGISQFDASCAGLGGCPFAPGATGNLATEDLVYLLQGLGIETGVDLEHLVDAADFICGSLGRAPQSRTARALLSRRALRASAA